jgi:PAS domain S-box-containing protein
VSSFQGVIHDITTERRAQLAMEETNRKMNDLTDAINAASLITNIDLDGVILDVNQKLCDVSGYTHEELLGSNQNIFNSGYHDKKFYANMWKTLKKGQIWHGEIRNRAQNGEFFWVETVMSPQLNYDKKPYAFLCIGIDITFRKTVEIQLRESELRFRELFEDTNDLIQGIDIDGKILFVNDSWEKVLGYKLKDIEDINFWNIVDKESIDKWESHWQTVTHTVNENDSVEIELTTKNGNSISIAGNSISSLTNGRLIIRSIFHDITPRKEAEKEILRSLDKEKELGELKSKFVATVSHQFRTPLTIILSNIELLDMLYNNDKKVSTVSYNRISMRIQDEVNRMTNLMNDVLILGKVSTDKYELRKTSIDLSKLCKNLKEQFDQIQDDGRKLELQVIGKNKDIKIDSGLINHALSNLIANAFKYSKGCRNPEFTVKYENKKIVLLVTDYGIGIKKPDIPFIFDAFFRTSNTSDIAGTGLGLNIAKEYIEIDNGKITVESKFGHGSTFRVELPY